jgi:hypothetical protein
MNGARSRSGRCSNTSKAQFHPFSRSSGAQAILARESEASSEIVVGVDVGFGRATVRLKVGPMRIRHAGEKFNCRGV